jgi:Tfp pilus assembly protein PilV
MKQAAAAQAVRRPSGMGIIEMIVGLALMTIAILGLSGLAVSATRANVSARSVDEATRLAQQKLEQVTANGYAAALVGTTVESNLNAAGTAGGGYTRTTVIAQGPLSTTRTITVTLAWTDFKAARSAVFVTEILQ